MLLYFIELIKLFTKFFHFPNIKARENYSSEDILLSVDNTKYKNVFCKPLFYIYSSFFIINRVLKSSC